MTGRKLRRLEAERLHRTRPVPDHHQVDVFEESEPGRTGFRAPTVAHD
ncbi:MAG: hypothetical protein R2878_05910 [Thermoleophilia bacterium]